jgi:hypothetical protein
MKNIQQLVNTTLNNDNNVYYLNLDISITELEFVIKQLSIKPDNTCIRIRTDFIMNYKLYITCRNDTYFGISIYNNDTIDCIYIIDITKVLAKIIFDSIDKYLINPKPYNNIGLSIDSYEEYNINSKLLNYEFAFIKAEKNMKLYIGRKNDVDYSITIKNNYHIHNIYKLANYNSTIANIMDRHHN